MKKIITVTNYEESAHQKNMLTRNTESKFLGEDDMDASDGYHTFTELYDHRITLFVTLCRKMNDLYNATGKGLYPWRSKLHSDGSVFDGWFILGLNIIPGEQITYHLPLDRWNETSFAETLEMAHEWDNHSSADIIGRLKNL